MTYSTSSGPEITMRPLTARENIALATASSEHDRAQMLYESAYGNKSPNLFKPERNDIPDKAVPPLTIGNEQDRKEREAFRKLESQLITQQNQTAPVARGEGYYQVLGRMHKDLTPDHLLKEAHRIKDINHKSDVLRVGQKLSLISDVDKERAVKSKMDAWDCATPEKRRAMLAEVTRQLKPEAPAHAPGHAQHREKAPAPQPQHQYLWRRSR